MEFPDSFFEDSILSLFLAEQTREICLAAVSECEFLLQFVDEKYYDDCIASIPLNFNIADVE